MAKDKTSWTLGRLVDLEYFLQHPPPAMDPEPQRPRSDSDQLRLWVEHGRHSRPDSPGLWLSRVGRVLYVLLLILMLVSGFGVARGVLRFDGIAPINLFVATAVLVGLPFLLSLIAALLLLASAPFAKSPGTSWGKDLRHKLVLHLVVPLVERLHRRADWVRSLRTGVQALWARGGLYTRVTGWTGFMGLQACGLLFGLGLYSGIVLIGAVEDLNFGWSTTSQRVTAERVETAAQAIATPWRWMNMEWTVPSLEHVAGSRFYRKDGVRGLDSAALQSWFPFLSTAIVVYSILPRLLLFLLGWLGMQRALRRLTFQDADCQAALRRIKGHSIRVRGDAAEPDHTYPSRQAAPTSTTPRVWALIHDEVAAEINPAQVEAALRNDLGIADIQPHVIALDETADAALWQKLPAKPAEITITLVLAGWRPCLEQTKDYIRALRRHGAADRPLLVALTGKARPGGAQDALTAEQVNAWQENILSLQDPYLDCINVSRPHEPQ